MTKEQKLYAALSIEGREFRNITDGRRVVVVEQTNNGFAIMKKKDKKQVIVPDYWFLAIYRRVKQF